MERVWGVGCNPTKCIQVHCTYLLWLWVAALAAAAQSDEAVVAAVLFKLCGGMLARGGQPSQLLAAEATSVPHVAACQVQVTALCKETALFARTGIRAPSTCSLVCLPGQTMQGARCTCSVVDQPVLMVL